MKRLGWHAVAVAVVMASMSLATGASGATDGSREVSARYVASPMDTPVSDPEVGVVVGAMEIEFLDDESRILATVSDDVFDRTGVTAVFFFGDAPIRHTVTFCRQHGMDIPDGATHVRLIVERPQSSPCSGDHGALTGTLSARIA